MADKKKMSVEDILAACRTENSGGDGAKSEESAKPVESEAPSSASAPAKKASAMSVEEMLAAARGGKGAGKTEKKPAAKPEASAAPAKKAAAMSVEEMLAAARAGTGAGKKETKAAAKPKAAKPAAAKKDAPKKAGAAGPIDTQSILAAARTSAKAGPMSKAEAAAKGSPAAGTKKKSAPPIPEKPAYAKAAPKKSKAGDTTRRGFVAAVSGCIGFFLGSALNIGFTSLGLTSLISGLGVARFFFPNILIEPPTKFKAGFPSEISTGQVETKFKAQFGVWIVRAEVEGQLQIYALSTVCTHLGCTPNWLEAEQKFKCPCHGSGFYKDGVNFEGPAPRPLERYAIRVAADGQLEIDKSRTFQDEMGQWSDPACYVVPV
ncbi:MAG: QcrA and Rieske domain-containing protein [Pirellulales bacterium]